MPESPGWSSPLNANFQHTLAAVTVTVAVPLPVEVVRRYLPVRVALSMTFVFVPVEKPVDTRKVAPRQITVTSRADTIAMIYRRGSAVNER